jgi:hypothetical protein
LLVTMKLADRLSLDPWTGLVGMTRIGVEK